MKVERAYQIIAEKYLHTKTFKEVVIPDSLMRLLRFMFTEEEAEIVAHLGLDYARCIGCGVCVVKCDEQKAISFKTRKIHKPPVDNIVEFWVRRYFQVKGREEQFLPKLTLGATRALSRVNPVHLTGPRARRLMK